MCNENYADVSAGFPAGAAGVSGFFAGTGVGAGVGATGTIAGAEAGTAGATTVGAATVGFAAEVGAAEAAGAGATTSFPSLYSAVFFPSLLNLDPVYRSPLALNVPSSLSPDAYV